MAKKGEHLSAEVKRKLSIALTGKKRSIEDNRKNSEAHKGLVKTEEHRRHLSEAKKGKPFSLEHKANIKKGMEKSKAYKNRGAKISVGVQRNIKDRSGINHWAYGRKFTEEHCKSLSEARNNRAPFSAESRRKMGDSHRGDKSHLWRGGVTPGNERIRKNIDYRLWREAVFARDNWTCRKCDIRGGVKIHAHHIMNFAEHPELRFAIDNGIVLCKSCHFEFHGNYGRTKNTEQQLNKYLNEEVLS